MTVWERLSPEALEAWSAYEEAVKENIRLYYRPPVAPGSATQRAVNEQVAQGAECRRRFDSFRTLALECGLSYYDIRRMQSQCYWDHGGHRMAPYN